jgi:DNA-binding transcriptional LysR family regulator
VTAVLDVRRLIMLRAVAAEGSIAGAARRLRYTRPTVSQQVSALEAEAGTALLDRSGHQITLTSAGRSLVEHAERILVELRAAEASLTPGAIRSTGPLRVGIPFREGPQIMSRALTEMRRLYPGMELRLAAVTDEDGPDAVRRDQLDIVIVSRYGGPRAPAGPPGLREWVLGEDPLTLWVPAGHPLAGAGECDLARLADESWILCPGTTLGRLVTSMCVTAGFRPRPAATVNDVGTAVGLVGMGWGITIAPERTPPTATAAVSRLRIAGLDAHRSSVLIVRDGEHLSPPMAAAISAVRSVSRIASPPSARRPVSAGKEP